MTFWEEDASRVASISKCDWMQRATLSRLSSFHRGYGATAARLTPDQKVGSSNLSALIAFEPSRC